MPVVEQKAGSCYVWTISTFLFLCITAGGILLAIYVSQPDASTWYAIVGISLVLLPWIFWFLTVFYRILSRRYGFRMACWGATVDSLPRSSTAVSNAATVGSAAAAGTEHSLSTTLESGTGSKVAAATDGGRKVRFADAVVVGGDHGDESVRSNESEAPLRDSMASSSSPIHD